MKHSIKIKPLLAALAVPLALGALAAFLIKDSTLIFDAVRKPPLAPPRWLFPVAWTLLYILMGISSYLIYVSKATQPRKDRALSLYAVQLALNFLWPLLFFNMQLYLAAFILLLLLILMIAACMVLFHYISPPAARLLIPYLAWCCFAAYLNLGVYLLNP